MDFIKCLHCGTMNDDQGNCISCGAPLPILSKKFEQKLVMVRPDLLSHARQVLAQCGFEELSCTRIRGEYELKLQRNVNMPSYNRVNSLTNEIMRELQPEVPKKRYATQVVFFVISMVMCFPFFMAWLATFITNLATHGEHTGLAGTALGMGITFGVFLVIGMIFMVSMISRIKSHRRSMAVYNQQLKDTKAKSDLCQKIILSLGEEE